MVDTADLKSAAERRTGSSPVSGTSFRIVAAIIYIDSSESPVVSFDFSL